MEAITIYASSIHDCRHAFKRSSLCQATSTYCFSAFTCCILVRLCVRESVYTIPFTSSYFCCSSHASISRRYMFESSYRVVRTLNNYSNNFVKPVTTLLTSAISIVITLAHCSLTSSGVEGCAFN